MSDSQFARQCAISSAQGDLATAFVTFCHKVMAEPILGVVDAPALGLPVETLGALRHLHPERGRKRAILEQHRAKSMKRDAEHCPAFAVKNGIVALDSPRFEQILAGTQQQGRRGLAQRHAA